MEDRRLKEENTIKVNEKKAIDVNDELQNRMIEEDSEAESYENDNYPNFEMKEQIVMKHRIEFMGKISLTCDGRNVSSRSRTVMAASVANALDVDINLTNISKTTAWRKGQEARHKQSKEIKDNSMCPDKVVVHWDGKTLTLRGRLESKRVCVYLSGVQEEKMRKLLGISETGQSAGWTSSSL